MKSVVQVKSVGTVKLVLTYQEAQWLKRYFVQATTGHDPYWGSEANAGAAAVLEQPTIKSGTGYDSYVAQPMLKALLSVPVDENTNFDVETYNGKFVAGCNEDEDSSRID
jgi:hypothetical protein